MKPSVSRIRWTLLGCAIAALAFTSPAQHPVPHNKTYKPTSPAPEVTKSQPTHSQDAKPLTATSPTATSPTATSLDAKPHVMGSGVAHSPAAQPPASKKALKKVAQVEQHFSESTSQLQNAETRIRSALQTATAQRKKFPGQAATLDPQIASLNQLLSHVTQLKQQVSSVQEPVQARIRMGAEVDKSEASAAENYTKALVKQANTDADQADKIVGNVSKNSAAAGGTPGVVDEGDTGNTPGNRAENAPGNATGNPPVDAPLDAPGGEIADVAPVESPAPPPDPEVSWFKKLQNGRLHYKVPPSMNWGISSTITVTIDGEAASPTPLAGENGESAIKVARTMTVQPSCPDNPDEFTFTPEPGTTPRQHVFADGTTTWNWSVKPKYTGTQQKIKIQAWVVYSDKDNIERELPVYDTAVDVRVPGFSECIKRLLEGNAEYWLHYGLPGGAGFIFASGVLTSLLKRLSNKKKPVPAS